MAVKFVWPDEDTQEEIGSSENRYIPEGIDFTNINNDTNIISYDNTDNFRFSERDNLTPEEDKELQRQVVKFDPDAILSLLDFIPQKLHEADWLSDTAKSYIPEDFDFVDPIDIKNPFTGEEVRYNEEMENLAIGFGHAIQDTSRGIKQILNLDIEKEKANEAIMNELYDKSTAAKIGRIGGFIVEPIGFLLPGAKFAKPLKGLVYGAATGGALGYLGYVDTAQGQTRTGNTVTGSLFGGGFTFAMNKVAKGIDNIKVKEANKTIDWFEREWSNLVMEGNDVRAANKILKENYSDELKLVSDAMELTHRKPKLAMTKTDAKEHLSYWQGLDKHVGSGGSVDRYTGIIHTRIKQYAPKFAKRLRDFEMNLHRRPYQFEGQVNEFAKVYKSLHKKTQDEVSIGLMNGDFQGVENILRNNVGESAVDIFYSTQKIFKRLGKELEGAGIIKNADEIENYWHRRLVDPAGFLEALGTNKKYVRTIVDKVAEKNKKLLKGRGYEMTPHEEATLVYGLLSNNKQYQKVGYAAPRGVKQTQEWMLKYYANPVESLRSYIHNAIFDIEQSKLLGSKNIMLNEDTHFFDPELSIKAWSDSAEELKGMPTEVIDEIRGMLRARLGTGQNPMSNWAQYMKIFSYGGLLANPISAVKQLGDLANSVYKNGLARSSIAMVKVLTGTNPITTKEFGLVTNLVQEFADVHKGHKALDVLMKGSGFKFVDRLGKSTIINSSFTKGLDAVKDINSKEFKALERKYRYAWGADWHTLVKDLKAYNNKEGGVTESIRHFVWNELSDMQPVSMSEVPQKYLEMKNGKLLYMLKTFMLKQADILRNDVALEAARGNYWEATKNATRYAVYLSGMNIGAAKMQDIMLDRDTVTIDDFEDVPGEMVSQFFSTFGINEYVRETARTQGTLDTVTSILLPPVNMLDDIFLNSWGAKPLTLEMGDPEPEKAARYLPWAGRMLYEEMK